MFGFFGSGGRCLGTDTFVPGDEMALCLGDCRLDNAGSSNHIQGVG